MSAPASPPERRAGAGNDPPGRPEAPAGAALDADNPWPGLAAFRESDRDFFHGREAEAAELLRLVRRDLLTVLFGLSGLGKSSLLRAAVFPTLRKENGLPVYLRVDHDEQAAHPVRQVMEAIRRAAEVSGVEAPSAEGVETLWEYFHRAAAVFWSPQNEIVTPVLVLDQFEELFTLGKSTAERARRSSELLTQLGDLIEGRAPASVVARLNASPDTAQAFVFGQTRFRAVFGLREDFLAELEDLREQIPSIANRMHLRRMTGDQALEVVRVPGGRLVTEEVAEEIVRFVAAGTGAIRTPGTAIVARQAPLNDLRVEPALLSLFCRELNEGRRARGAAEISTQLLRENQTAILEGYYERCMRDRPPAVRTFVEDELVTVSGYRNSAALDDALARGMSLPDIDTLVDRRLLRVEERGTVNRVELTHDVLTPVLSASRDRRQQREALDQARREAAKRRRQLAVAVAIAGLFVALSVALFKQWTDATRTLALTYYRDGVTQLHEGRNRSGAASLAHALQLYPRSTVLTRALGLDLSSMFIRTAVFTSLLYSEWPVAILPHADGVVSAAFSPDGTRVVTASADHTARLWDARSGVPLAAPPRHAEAVSAAAFSPDGTRVVTASWDGTARLWDARTGVPIGEPLQHDRPVSSAAFSRDGSRVVTASEDHTARLWDAQSGAALGAPLKHGGIVYSAAFSGDGTRVVTASADHTARLWDARSNDPLGEPLRHGGIVYSAAFSPDGTRVVTASEDRTARLWEAGTGAPVGPPLAHDGIVWSAVFSGDGTRIVTASEDRTARLWEAGTGSAVGQPLRHDGAVRWATFSPDGGRVVTASADHTARLWNAADGHLIGSPFRHENAVGSAVFSADGSRVVTASADHTARLWDARAGAALGQALRHEDVVQSAAFAPDGTRVVTASADHTARLWDARTAAPVGDLLRHDDVVSSAAFSPDGALLLTASADGSARLWDARTGAPSDEPLRHDGGIQSAAFSPDGSRIVTASEDHTARLWDARSRRPVGGPLQHDGMVTSAAFSPDGARVVTASGNAAHVWDARTGAELSAPGLQHDVRVWSAMFSPDGARIVTASADKRAQVWDVRTRKKVGEPLQHDAPVRYAAFSPDGALVVTAATDGTTRLWDAGTGTPIGEPLRHDEAVQHAAFSPDGTRLVTASADHTARLWDVAADPAIAAEGLAEFVETVAGRRLDDTGLSTEMTDRQDRLAESCAGAAAPRPEGALTLEQLEHWFCADRATRPISPRAAR